MKTCMIFLSKGWVSANNTGYQKPDRPLLLIKKKKIGQALISLAPN